MWEYKNKPVFSHKDLLADCTNIVYQITYINGRKYIGKKAVKGWRTLPPLKGKKRKRKVLKNL